MSLRFDGQNCDGIFDRGFFWGNVLAKVIKLKFGSARGFWVRCKACEAQGSVPTPLRTRGHGQSHCASLEWVIRFAVAVRRHDICVDK